jgi:ribosomal protein L25 (general stress protein Ctc)
MLITHTLSAHTMPFADSLQCVIFNKNINITIYINMKDFRKCLDLLGHNTYSMPISISLDDKSLNVVITEIQRNRVKDIIQHASLFCIDGVDFVRTYTRVFCNNLNAHPSVALLGKKSKQAIYGFYLIQPVSNILSSLDIDCRGKSKPCIYVSDLLEIYPHIKFAKKQKMDEAIVSIK